MSDSSPLDIAEWYMHLAQSKDLGASSLSLDFFSKSTASSAPGLMQTGSTLYLTSQDFAASSARWSQPTRSYLTPLLLSEYGNSSTITLAKTTSTANTVSQAAMANVTAITIKDNRRRIGEARPSVVRIAEWDGYVEEIFSDYFVARMHGLYGVGVLGKDEDAEIPVSDVDDGDRDLLVLGGFFRLLIADEMRKVGPKRRYTSVQFRRMPAYSKRELDAAKQEADALINAFQLEKTGRSASA